jgi:hypothetical protein
MMRDAGMGCCASLIWRETERTSAGTCKDQSRGHAIIMKEAMHLRAPPNGWMALAWPAGPYLPLTKIPKSQAVETSGVFGLRLGPGNCGQTAIQTPGWRNRPPGASAWTSQLCQGRKQTGPCMWVALLHSPHATIAQLCIAMLFGPLGPIAKICRKIY